MELVTISWDMSVKIASAWSNFERKLLQACLSEQAGDGLHLSVDVKKSLLNVSILENWFDHE